MKIFPKTVTGRIVLFLMGLGIASFIAGFISLIFLTPPLEADFFWVVGAGMAASGLIVSAFSDEVQKKGKFAEVKK